MRNGDWYNLVVINDLGARTHIKKIKTHQHAAYQLSPHYYEWIRLHQGIMREGLDHTEMLLQKTKHYAFVQPGLPPMLREQSYEPLAAYC